MVLGWAVMPGWPAWAAEKPYRIGYLLARGPDAKLDHAFVQGLNELGYQEGKNILIVRRFGQNKPESLPGLASELAAMKLDVIVAAPNLAVLAAKRAATATPIVMATASDPVGNGIVTALARPGGNVTGLSNFGTDLIGKELELLKETLPRFEHVAFLVNAGNQTKGIQLREVRSGAKTLGVRLSVEEVRGVGDLERAVKAIAVARPDAVVVAIDPLLFGERRRLARLLRAHRLPAVATFREFAEVGGLMTYGANLADMFRRSAMYVDKILKGAQPGDLPVEQPLKFELIVSRGTATALGLTIPQSLLLRADEVIQ
jgi:putative ABC transport system substrate-binding protein